MGSISATMVLANIAGERHGQSEKEDGGDYGGSDSSQSFSLNLQKDGAERGLDRIISEVHSGEIIAEHRRRLLTRLSELCQKIQEPLNLGECRGQSSVLCFGRTATDGGLLRALPGDQIGVIEDAVAHRGSSIIRVTGPVRICKNGKSQIFALIKFKFTILGP
ncbi:hypothetical protein PIB30_016139 [Stylosanthes scabra]|uniref:Uncharacterized protein n=1 Tax=Stylosanthes scabra TaxID=79078 RepID=A0ABU6S7V2_9FABA|nr:hypothetical protein [Stylosanthes scabra]